MTREVRPQCNRHPHSHKDTPPVEYRRTYAFNLSHLRSQELMCMGQLFAVPDLGRYDLGWRRRFTHSIISRGDPPDMDLLLSGGVAKFEHVIVVHNPQAVGTMNHVTKT